MEPPSCARHRYCQRLEHWLGENNNSVLVVEKVLLGVLLEVVLEVVLLLRNLEILSPRGFCSTVVQSR